jgi:hypothetical protein
MVDMAGISNGIIISSGIIIQVITPGLGAGPRGIGIIGVTGVAGSSKVVYQFPFSAENFWRQRSSRTIKSNSHNFTGNSFVWVFFTSLLT